MARVSGGTGAGGTNDYKIGPAMILKVMAGDKFNVQVNSWYKTTSGQTPNTPTGIVNVLLSALNNSVGGLAGGKVSAAELNTANAFVPGANTFLNNQAAGTNNNLPRAYLNWILFDEQFNYVSSSSGFEQVPAESYYNNGNIPNNNTKLHVRNNMPIDKSGFLYIYVSNETPNIDVFFDNLQVTHIRGQILEETHYYPFGLVMAGISSEAAKGTAYPTNKKKYNGIEETRELGLNEYDAQLRILDPQIAVWWQVDPQTENMEMWSPYTSNYDNPILYKDPLGNEPGCCKGILDAINTTLAATLTVLADNVLGTNITGAVANSGAIPSTQVENWNGAVNSANRASQVVGIGSTIVGGAITGGSVAITEGTLGISIEITGPTALLGLGVTAVGSLMTINSTKNLAEKNGLIRDKDAPAGTYDNKPKSTKDTKRVVDQTPGEKALNQKEGIEKRKAKLEKVAPPGENQQTINSDVKSKQNLTKQLKSVKNSEDAKNLGFF